MSPAFDRSNSIEFLPRSSVVSVPSLGQAFLDCDSNLLADVVMDGYVVGLDRLSEFGAERICAVQECIESSLQQMRNYAAILPCDQGKVVVPRETFLLESSSLRILRRIDACCVDLQDLEDVTFLYDDPQIDFSFSDMPWEQALAMPVWYLSAFCEQERYMMLASAFWELTRHGFSKEEHDAGLWELPKVVDPVNGVITTLSQARTARRPAGFDWGYRRRLRSRIIELNRCAEENLFLTLKGMSQWAREASVREDRRRQAEGTESLPAWVNWP